MRMSSATFTCVTTCLRSSGVALRTSAIGHRSVPHNVRCWSCSAVCRINNRHERSGAKAVSVHTLMTANCHTMLGQTAHKTIVLPNVGSSKIHSVVSSAVISLFTTRSHKSGFPVQPSARRNLTLSAKAIVDASPLPLQPYLRLIRLDRPIGTWLLFLPSAWSLSLATPAGVLPDATLIALFGLGSFLMRSAGCTINDMWDKDFDSQVARTKSRPIACGEISRSNALIFLALPLSASLGILLTLNYNTIILGCGAVLPCIVYPLMKRVTYWPQAFLGLTFNYGVLMGWSAVRGMLEWPVLPLYASCIAWTLVYDTLYAFQDRKDDQNIGIKSTALRFGESTRAWLTCFTSFLTMGLVTTGVMCEQAWPYYVGVGLFTAHLGHQIYTVDLSNPDSCGQKFRSNRNIGLIFWAFVLASSLYKKKNMPPVVDQGSTESTVPV